MNADGTNLVLILGNYKSGSTWLLTMLSLHPWIRGVRETQIFTHLESSPDLRTCTRRLYSDVPWSDGGRRNLLRHRLVALAGPVLRRWRPALQLRPSERPASLLDLGILDQLALKRRLLGCSTEEEYCRVFFGFLAQRLRPRGYLLEKSPGAANHVPFIRRTFPDAKLVIVYRDGRDVVVSSRFFVQNHLGKEWALRDGVLAWRRDIEAQRRFAGQYGVFTCSYEDLLSDGAPVLHRLLEYLDLPRDEPIVQDLLHRSSFRFLTGRDRGQESRGRFLRKGIAGDWRNHFTEDDKRVFKEVAGDLLIELGYEKDLDW